MAHLNRQEANFYWSVRHSAAIHVTTKTDRERQKDREQWEDQHISEEENVRCEPKEGTERKQTAGGWMANEK